MNHYETLGVKPNASPEEIKKAHRKKARKKHPDVPGGNHKEFIAIQIAYEVLSDEERRKRYDNGEPEGNTISIEQEAINFLLFAFQSAINDIEEKLLFTNFIQNMQLVINEEEKSIKALIKKEGKQISRLIKIRRNLKFKGKGDNFFLNILESHIRGLKQNIKHNHHQLEIRKLARTLIVDYEFEPYKRPAVEEITLNLSNFTFTANLWK